MTMDDPRTAPGATRIIITAGVTAAILDITWALVVWGSRGLTPGRLLQGIATGLLGKESFSMGVPSMILGALIHTCIATTIAATYYGLSRLVPKIVAHPLIFGPLGGAVAYLVMTYVAVPLSRAHMRPPTVTDTMIGLAAHILCIGLPIALITSRRSRR